VDARLCISYLTIELKDDIPVELRPLMADWVFGCDICQTVCPWNRFAQPRGDPAFEPNEGIQHSNLIQELELASGDFNRKFKDSPVKRPKRRGYLRNVAIAVGNSGDSRALPMLEKAAQDSEPMIREHAAWAIEEIKKQEKNG
jgi:epoxyqueuosine reductase